MERLVPQDQPVGQELVAEETQVSGAKDTHETG